jgi:protein subunit release factor A
VNVDPLDVEVSMWPPAPEKGMRVGMFRGVKMVHKPTLITVTCDCERSQHRNRDVALAAIAAAVEATERYRRAE